MFDLNNKIAIVTGASQGIGAATAKLFAQAGAQVVLAARNESKIHALAAEITASGGTAAAVPCDVADPSAVAHLIECTTDQFGIPDILINNAGIIDPISRLANADISDWERVIDVNVKGVFYATRLCLPLMVKRGGGTIISVGSGAATSALGDWSAYCTSKAAVHHFHNCLHREEADNNIRSFVLSPGTVATNMQRIIAKSGVGPVAQLAWDDHVPPEWAAQCLAWMATPDADAHAGSVVSLRDADIRAAVGLN